ncbi:lysophospholipid acyltransferase LPEAT1 isoform X2 [Dendrobium catenatum]|uniref:lysophospholipid acyltransferase LPEAT1 isoform X2 n=1 Tax=Dendrobium catenatum TaxID=906689 RepID=UPI0010A0470E|nr:lysophospholipid acyltransferase LPEAT1 isoform X2 [Dendrobium catenatum]
MEMASNNGSLCLNDDSPSSGCVGLDQSGKAEQPLLKSKSSASESQPAACVVSESLNAMEKKYGAFVRKDAYGIMGRGELPTVEKVLLGIAVVTLVPIRLAVGIFILVLYYVICRFCTLFLAPNRNDEQEDYAHMTGWRRDVVVRCGRFLSRAMLFNFGFYWIEETRLYLSEVEKPLNKHILKGNEVTQCFSSKERSLALLAQITRLQYPIIKDEHSEQTDEFKRAGVIVSNHVSYLDILYHMSSSFPSFVAKRSVAKLPLVGIISKCLGCVFVQRESKASDFMGVSGVVTKRIQEAHQNNQAPMMLLFPEGTTTNGDYLLPFKTGAFLAKVPVLPVILRYPYQRFSPAWDSISGLRHVFLLLCQFINYIEVTRLPVYYPSDQEREDPKLYASNVRKLMASEGNLILSDVGLPEKRIYHAALNGLFIQS